MPAPEFKASPVVASFELLAIPNEMKTKKEGRPIFDEKEVCRIRFAGNKMTVGVYPAHEVFEHAAREPGGFVEPITYAMKFNEAYRQFKAGEAQTVAGTPLSELPFLTTGKRLELKALNIHTAETLAALDGHPLKMLGMQGRELKNKATAYLEAAAGTRNTEQMNEALESRDREIAELRASIARLEAAGADSSAAAAVTGDATPGPFDDFTSEDLVNWIRDADPATKIDGRWSAEKLRSVATEINARLKSKAA